MIMGSKTVRQEDSLVSIGGYIITILKEKEVNIDELYASLNEVYPKEVKFGVFINTLYFLFMIKKIFLVKADYIGLCI